VFDGFVDVSTGVCTIWNWLDNGSSSGDRQNMAAGSYTLVAMTCDSACTDTLNVTITEPSAMTATMTIANASAAGVADGNIDLSVSGGSPCVTSVNLPGPLLGGNGQAGNAFNIINTSGVPMTITGLSQGPGSGGAATPNVTTTVHYYPGDYLTNMVGISNASLNGWVLAGTATNNLTAGAATGYVPVSVVIPVGATYGFYVENSSTIQYTNGSGVPGVGTWFSDANITVTEGHGCYGQQLGNPWSFAFSPRNWNGTVHYGDPNATAYTFAWSTGDTTEDIGSLLAGGYCVTVTDCNGCTASFCDSVGISLEPGCTDPLAINYSSTANVDDGSCIYMILGCADSTAFNYNPLANTPDPNDPCCYQSGCMDPFATNYDAGACWDDSTLCTYPTANVSPFCDDFESGSSATYGWLLAQQTYASVMVWGNGATFVVNGHPGANGPINGNYSLNIESTQ
jgi:hypothetical protein